MLCKIVGGTKVPENEKSWERKFLGTKGPWSESSLELSFPGNEKSRERKFPIGTIRFWERKVLGTKSPGTSPPIFLLMHSCPKHTSTCFLPLSACHDDLLSIMYRRTLFRPLNMPQYLMASWLMSRLADQSPFTPEKQLATMYACLVPDTVWRRPVQTLMCCHDG